MRSENTKKGVERMPARSLYYATGVTKKDWDKPFIGIVSSFTDLIPGHISMRDLERAIEKGVHSAGGYSFILSVPGICDGIAMGHSGMYYSLPSREAIADAIECVVQGHQLDGLVLLTNCDKINPGMMIAAGRLNIPAIVVTAGPMHSGNYKNVRRSLVRDTFEAVGNYQKGLINDIEFEELCEAACPGPGACQGMYTANTTACVIESLGMSLPGCATALAGFSKKRRIAYLSGMQIVELVKQNITPRKIITEASIENAIRVDLALGGSTNTCLHIPAIANAAGIKITLDWFDRLGKDTPHIANIRPGGEHFMEDLEYAGGISAVLNRLKTKLKSANTVALKNILEIAESAKVINPEVIRSIDNPYHKEGGIAVLKGNIAPDGCVVKQSAVSEKMKKFTGKARVFNCEEDAMKEVMAGKIKENTVIVIRYEGPKGGP
ncbi:MAG TPA: dihydroxy-acid dehydratase, partial [bacterium]|nr:dihydroxy-acid dehydratase [bacterium]